MGNIDPEVGRREPFLREDVRAQEGHPFMITVFASVEPTYTPARARPALARAMQGIGEGSVSRATLPRVTLLLAVTFSAAVG